MTITGDAAAADIPRYPAQRASGCPYQPPAAYADWHGEGGLRRVRFFDGSEPLLVSRYEDIREAMGNPSISADSRNPHLPANFQPHPAFPRMDDPEHARIRRQLTSHFTVKRMEALRPLVAEVCHDRLERMIAIGAPADLVEHYALPIPSQVICRLLGVPYEAHDFFETNSAALFDPELTAEQKTAGVRNLFDYACELIGTARREPGDDIIGRQAALVDRGELDATDAAMNIVTLLTAGHETTANMISLATLTLLDHSELAARLRDSDDPKYIANAVEELLRFLTIAEGASVRVAAEDTVVAGTPVKADEGLVMCLPSANREARIFEHPDEIDFDRDVRGHLAFGYGVHQCVGQHLARVELQIALPALLRRLPDLRLAVPHEDIPLRTSTILGVTTLPVTW